MLKEMGLLPSDQVQCSGSSYEFLLAVSRGFIFFPTLEISRRSSCVKIRIVIIRHLHLQGPDLGEFLHLDIMEVGRRREVEVRMFSSWLST